MSLEQTSGRQWQDYDMKEYAENYEYSNSRMRTTAHISCLYPEILALIFGYLDVRDKGRVARVCAAWKEASYYKCVWRGVEARLHLRRANPSLFPSLVRRGIRRVQVLSLRRSLRDVIQGLPNIERLNLSGCYNLTDSWLGHAFSREVTTLVELHLGMCKQITDSSIGRISKCLPNLEILDLGGCSGITNTSLQLIATELKRLQRLNLRSCRHISDTGISHLAGIGANAEGSVSNLSLKYLGLQDCQKLTDDALKYASIGLVHLRGVNLSFCSGVTDFGLKHLARMSSLQELNLRSCDGVSDTGMAYLAEGGSRVVSLDVSFCEKVGDRGMLHISQGLFHLKCLSLNSCSVSDEGISRVATTLTELHTLYIGQCSRVTDKGLGLIADNLRRLTCIDLYGCPKLTKGGLEKIMQLPNLSEINLGLWQKNPDRGMKLFCNF